MAAEAFGCGAQQQAAQSAAVVFTQEVDLVENAGVRRTVRVRLATGEADEPAAGILKEYAEEELARVPELCRPLLFTKRSIRPTAVRFVKRLDVEPSQCGGISGYSISNGDMRDH